MFLRGLFVLLLALGLALPAQAVLTLGVAPDHRSQLRSESAARRLAAQLQGRLNEEVRLRVFHSEAELNEWMQRYRVVDLALISRGFYNQQPAGSLQLLAQPAGNDLAVARPGLSPDTLVRLRNAMPALESALPAPLAQPAPQKTAAPRTRKPAPTALRPSDQELQPGQEILAAPGQAPRITAQPSPPVRRAQAKQTKPPSPPKVARAKTPPPPPATAVASKPPAPVVETPAPATVAAPPAPPPALVLPPPQAAPSQPQTAPPPPSQEPAVPPASSPLQTPAPPEVQPDSASPIPWLGILVLVAGFGYLFHRRRQQSRPNDWSAVNQKKPRPTSGDNPKKPAPRPSRAPVEKDPAAPRGIAATRVVLPPTRKPLDVASTPAPEPVRVVDTIALAEEAPAAADAMAALLTDQTPQTFAEDHQSLDLPALELEQEPALELQIPPLEAEETSPALPGELPPLFPAAVEAEPQFEDKDAPSPVERKSRKSTSLPPLRGDMASVDIQRLLEAAAAQPGPCILHIRGQHDEKRLHFRKGHLADAASVNRANRAKTGFLMNKVGYLLIRQGRITEEQRDQALRLCEQRPKLRIGEALVELGALSRESLLEALQTQAEGVIFSLFIFPDGRYEIVADDSDTSVANDLNISLASLLSKIEAQEPEWHRIRQAIPSLDTILDFPEGGRDKLDSARMTEHQKLILSLINGHRPIRDICIAATMLDLEVYKFLFFMVNAKILTRVSAT